MEKVLVPMGRGVHRALIKPGAGKRSFLSQTDVIRWMLSQQPLGGFLGSSVSELGLGRQLPVCAVPTDTGYGALRRAFANGVRSMPVVDSSGTLLASISHSDLETVDFSNITSVEKPVLSFLETNNCSGLNPVVCQPTTSLENALQTALAQHAHMIWVVDEHKKLLGCLAFSDVLARFADFLSNSTPDSSAGMA